MCTIFHKLILITLAAIGLVSCNGGTSLEEYYVDNKENNDFVALDVPTSLIAPDADLLTPEQQKVLKTVKKVNILALPLKAEGQAGYMNETGKVDHVLRHDHYQQLMTFGEPSKRMQLFFKGDEENIDELVVFARDDTKGFVLARLLGDDMNVGDMIKFAKNMGKNGGNLNVSQFEGIMDIFNNH